MSESAFRVKGCSCHECEAVDRLREIIREKDAEILRLTKALKREQSIRKANP